jgi:hypothetical protein
VRPSPFAFAYVQSSSPINGVSAIYTVSLTIAVDTPASTPININLPEQLEFDETLPFVCRGTLELIESLPCIGEYRNVIEIRLTRENSINAERQGIYSNGTTVQFEVGHLKNHLSLAPTDTFKVKSYARVNADVFLINQNTTGLEIRNSEAGKISMSEIIHTNRQLGEDTTLKMLFESQSDIPFGMNMQVTLPSNIKFDTARSSVRVNGRGVQVEINEIAFMYSFELPDSGRVWEVEIDGLMNPEEGPYDYSQF